MNFRLTDEQLKFKEMVEKFAEEEIKPNKVKWENAYPDRAQIKRYAELGLMGLPWSKKYGGQGKSFVEAVIAIEAIAKVSPCAAHPIFEGCCGPIVAIEKLGTEAQKEKYLRATCNGDMIVSISMTEPNAGSALTDLTTKAELKGDHYVLNGRKRFIVGGGYSDAFLVYCRLNDKLGAKGIGAIIVEKDFPGLSYGEQEEMMGFDGFPCCDLIFEDCIVPKENLLTDAGEFAKLMGCFNVERLGNTTMSLAIAEAALEETVKYTQERQCFGKEIIDFQAVQLQVANMAIKIEAGKLLLYRNAVEASEGTLSTFNSSVGKCFNNEICMEVTDMAMSCHGGYGFSKRYPIESMLRDSRGWALAGGTTQMQKINIAAALTGRKFNHRK